MNKTWVIDLDRCTGCQTCMVSCKFENGLGLGVNRTDVIEVGPTGTWPDIEMYWMPYRCQQCSDAPCVEARRRRRGDHRPIAVHRLQIVP